MSYIKSKKILLTGGGTGGSVTPLLAISQELLNLKGSKSLSRLLEPKFLWLGTKSGPEKDMVKAADIKFKAIASGKFRRYFSWRNLIDFFFIKLSFYQSLYIILKWKPDIVMSAGSFVSVPVVWAAWLLRVPVLIHQQDVRPGLANKLMAPFARIITVTFEKSLNDYGKKAVWTGNPVRSKKLPACADREVGSKNYEKFGLKENLPVILVLGGGTGALAINELMERSVNELVEFYQVVHITGKGKKTKNKSQIKNYKNYEFLDAQQMAEAYSVADVVVSRCGMGVLTELSYLGKPSILIPIPGSHQEDNAEILYKNKASLVLDQNELTSEKFVRNIRRLLDDKKLREELSNNIRKVIKKGANEKIVEIIISILQQSKSV